MTGQNSDLFFGSGRLRGAVRPSRADPDTAPQRKAMILTGDSDDIERLFEPASCLLRFTNVAKPTVLHAANPEFVVLKLLQPMV